MNSPMPETLRPTGAAAVLYRLVLVAAILAAFMGAPASADADDERQIRMVITGNTGPIFRPYPQTETTMHRHMFGEAVDEALASDLETFLLDAGNASTPFQLHETYYDLHMPRVATGKGYAAVNQTGSDHLNWGLVAWGVRSRPANKDDYYLSAFNYPVGGANRSEIPVSLHRPSEVVEGGVNFLSASGRERISGTSVQAERTTFTDPREAIQQLLDEREADAPRPLLVVFSDLSPEDNEALAFEFEDIDLLIEVRPGGDEVRQIGRTHLLGGADGHEIRIVTLTLAEDDRIESIELDHEQWIEAEDLAALVNIPKPTIGMSVRPAQRVAERLGVDINTVNLDVFRGTPLPELSDRENVYVYRLVKDGRDYHIIRTHHAIGNGWINFDALVQIDPETNTVVDLETNLPDYPIGFISTRMADIFEYLYDKPVEEWDFPEEMAGGIEMQVEQVIEALRATLVANEMLYGDQTD